jgi:hypothetical protein
LRIGWWTTDTSLARGQQRAHERDPGEPGAIGAVDGVGAPQHPPGRERLLVEVAGGATEQAAQPIKGMMLLRFVKRRQLDDVSGRGERIDAPGVLARNRAGASERPHLRQRIVVERADRRHEAAIL